MENQSLLKILIFFSILIASSCVKTLDEQPITLAGKWAKVDGAFLTSEYVEFRSGEMTEYEADESKSIYNGTIWNSSESDFKKKSSGRYSVKEGVLIVSDTDRGKISVKGEELFVGTETYMKISGFSSKELSSIFVREEVTCDYHSQEISVGYQIHVSETVSGARLIASCEADWIEDITVSQEDISIKVSENNSGDTRLAVVKLDYPGASSVAVTVYQSYSAPEIIVEPESLNCGREGGTLSLSYRVENPRVGEVLHASCTASWVSDIAVGTDNVSFKVSRNTTLQPRTSEIILEYKNGSDKVVSVIQTLLSDLSLSGTANCYIVTRSGEYTFAAVKGNSSEPVGAVASAEVLWESFGTDVAPKAGDLVSGVQIEGDRIAFAASDLKGNAVIAARDASGNILWSWHIWMTDQPKDQVYNNGAGTMMDRNLGATSATPGSVGALGLLYQWGRKDPFLGSSSISSNTRAKSTLSWPSPVKSTASTGTIDYAVSNPVTFITSNGSNADWYYTGNSSTDNTRWRSSKTIYDPCPAGYRVPDGGYNGIWSKAFGTSSSFDDAYDSTNEGFNFGSSGKGTKKLSNSVIVCWYPADGCLSYYDGSLFNVGDTGYCWSCSPNGHSACNLSFLNNGRVYPSSSSDRAYGYSVRCLKE